MVQALKDVTVSLEPGDRVGLIGTNGAGKSTLLRVIAGIYEPDTGDIHISGDVMPLLDLGLGFDGDLTGRENIRMRGMYLGLKPHDSKKLVPEIAAFTELGDYLDLPVRTYSSGMQMRLSLGVATAIQPDILLMDEWMMAGDATFMEKAKKRIDTFIEKANILVLASHSEAIIRQWCNKAIMLKGGNMISYGKTDNVFKDYNRIMSSEKI
ncbi:ABC transporter ATP-binding protein [Pararhodospirillum photometricum]|uniref:ABC transporter ATP-binding protein n=1 Tax=Pararhodospirillum photometricum TaxID=1084 RepID=UPI001F59DF01|nr:ABC transporter ATP-binding protein [Pararhodospirillum photometricum]